jgi:hypothetical protein
MPSVTGYYKITAFGFTTSGYMDIIICKREINGVDHYDTETKADNDCKNIGHSLGLWTTSLISTYQTTPTNDQAMLNKYIDLSVCGKHTLKLKYFSFMQLREIYQKNKFKLK